MATKGPLTKDTSTVALGLAQIRVGKQSENVGNIHNALAAANSIGALANTKFTHSIDYWRLESGFPLLEDYVVPLRSAASLECAFKEVTPFNMALAHGIDPMDAGSVDAVGYDDTHSGEVALGNLSAAEYIRVEARYTYPNDTNYMDIVFPRAQASSAVEMDLQAEDAAAVPITFEAKRADSEITDATNPGSSVWDNKPLGRIAWS